MKASGETGASARRRRAGFVAGWGGLALALLLLGACGSMGPGHSTLPNTAALPAPDPTANSAVVQQDYRIGPLDTLDISVFEVENLKQTVQVDASGMVEFPLIGSMQAATKTTRELAQSIGAKLGERYLQSPQVTVVVRQSVSQKFTVEGAVKTPGVYPILGRMSLLQAIATAQGVDYIANVKSVVVFRTIDQKRMAAVADLDQIRSGRVADPEIYAGDLIVVTMSKSRRLLQNIIGVTPLVVFLTPFGL